MQFDWKSYFIFTSKEQKGILVLGCILALSLLLHYLLPKNQSSAENHLNTKVKATALFYFDPNLLDSPTGYKLGIAPKQMRTLYNYRAKGGRFKNKEALQKLYGWPAQLTSRLMPWVRINNKEALENEKHYFKGNLKYSAGEKIDINNLDPTEWIRITGLPMYKVKRILTYQKWTGGFTSSNAIKKVYGITTFDFEMIRPFLKYRPVVNSKMAYQTMRHQDWVALGIFDEQTSWAILRFIKERKGKLTWSEIVIQFDLTETEAQILKKRTNLMN